MSEKDIGSAAKIRAAVAAYFHWREEQEPAGLVIKTVNAAWIMDKDRYNFEIPAPPAVDAIEDGRAPIVIMAHIEAAPIVAFTNGLDIAWIAYSVYRNMIAIALETMESPTPIANWHYNSAIID